MLIAGDELQDDLAHVRNKGDDPQRTQTAKHQQRLGARMRRDARRLPAGVDQTNQVDEDIKHSAKALNDSMRREEQAIRQDPQQQLDGHRHDEDVLERCTHGLLERPLVGFFQHDRDGRGYRHGNHDPLEVGLGGEHVVQPQQLDAKAGVPGTARSRMQRHSVSRVDPLPQPVAHQRVALQHEQGLVKKRVVLA